MGARQAAKAAHGRCAGRLMHFTDIFIRRPVLATVVSLLVLVLGLRALLSLPIRQFPKTENATVTVTTLYYGASADLVAGFITTPIESAVAEAQRSEERRVGKECRP